MSIQDIFYILASIFMIAGILLICFIGFITWKIYANIQKAQETIRLKVTEFVESKKTGVASMVGMGLAKLVIGRVKNIFRK